MKIIQKIMLKLHTKKKVLFFIKSISNKQLQDKYIYNNKKLLMFLEHIKKIMYVIVVAPNAQIKPKIIKIFLQVSAIATIDEYCTIVIK